jgi:membrane associated rhomboid family serine protease
MQSMRTLDRPVRLLGHSFPLVAVLLAGATLATSILAAVTFRNGGLSLAGLLALQARHVLTGEIWRLVTWPLVDSEPLSLFFACLILLMLGRDLAYAWGPQRLLAFYFGCAALGALMTVLVGQLLWGEVARRPYLTPWAAVDALMLAWAVRFPQRQVLLMFVLPLGGRHLIYGVVGLTLLDGLLRGMAGVVPHFLTMGLAWLFVSRPSWGTMWLRLRYRVLQWRRGRHLRVVEPARRPRSEDAPSERPRWYH